MSIPSTLICVRKFLSILSHRVEFFTFSPTERVLFASCRVINYASKVKNLLFSTKFRSVVSGEQILSHKKCTHQQNCAFKESIERQNCQNRELIMCEIVRVKSQFQQFPVVQNGCIRSWHFQTKRSVCTEKIFVES